MTDEKPQKRRTWVGEWVRDKTFWRDVASRALAGLIVVFMAGVVGAAAGFINWGIVGVVGVYTAWVVILMAAGIGLATPVIYVMTRLEKRIPEGKKSEALFGGLVSLLSIGTFLATFAVLSILTSPLVRAIADGILNPVKD